MRLRLQLVLAIFCLIVVQERASAASATLCDQNVSFNIVPPAADVPADVRAFSGVWLGHVAETGRCMAIIVENVGRDGAIQMIGLLGPLPGYAANASDGFGCAKFGTQTANVKNGVMGIVGRSGKFKVSKPDEMTGTAELGVGTSKPMASPRPGGMLGFAPFRKFIRGMLA